MNRPKIGYKAVIRYNEFRCLYKKNWVCKHY